MNTFEATHCSCIKCLKSICEILLLYLVVEILQLVHEISSFPTKEVIWKTSQNSQIITRSSHRRCSLRKGVLRIFSEFTRKHLCQRLLKKSLWHRCFPMNLAPLRTPFLQNTSERLLLNHKKQSSGCVLSENVLKNFAKFADKHLCRSLF